MRQNIQLELAFPPIAKGEAPRIGTAGTEASAATGAPESPAVALGSLMEAIVDRDNMRKALARVRRNKGAPGVDGMSVHDLTSHLKNHWPLIRDQLVSGTYRPMPVRRVDIPKPNGGTRALGIPTVVDRLIQQAVMQVLQADWDPTFSEHSHGFRPGRSAHGAVRLAQEYIASGHRWVVDIDLEKFFDKVNHDILMGLVAKRVTDPRLLRLIRGFLTSGVLLGGLVSPTAKGMPQGGPLSPLLSNLMLNELDRELERRNHRFVRYADDCNIYVCSERAGHRVMASVVQFVERRLKLKVNTAKSAVARPVQRKFLGFSFTNRRPVKRRIAPQTLERFKQRVRELTKRNTGVSLQQMVKELSVYLRGWIGYFGLCETPWVLKRLDEWLRRRLRCFVWKRWKTRRRQFAELRKLGVSHGLARRSAGTSHGPFHTANSPAMAIALPPTFFTSLGLVTLSTKEQTA